MPPAPTMVFPFQELSDAKGLTTFRPVIPLRPMSAPLGHSERCLVDTGSPNTYVDWRLATLAGVDLSQAKKIPDPQEWSVGGVAAEELSSSGSQDRGRAAVWGCRCRGARDSPVAGDDGVGLVIRWARARGCP
jgi:hypothetical protein